MMAERKAEQKAAPALEAIPEEAPPKKPDQEILGLPVVVLLAVLPSLGLVLLQEVVRWGY